LIGAVVFVGVLVLLTLLSIAFPSLPPAAIILENWLGVSLPGYEVYLVYLNAIFNGIIYGVAGWLVFGLVNYAVGRVKKKVEKADLALCPKCKNVVAADKTWNSTTRPSEIGKRTQMKIGHFNCLKCGKTFRRILSKKNIYA
jgi:hypothetical protein